MSAALHCYEYVNLPFEKVRDALVNEGVDLFGRATRAAAGRADGLVSNLKVSIAGFEVGRNVVIRVTGVHPAVDDLSRALRLDLEWRAESKASLFPWMRATLLASAFAEETRLDLRGTYEPPGGVLGGAAERLLGHRVAEASVHRFLDELATRLCEEIG